MKERVVLFMYKGRKIRIKTTVLNFIQEGLGLMFKKQQNARALLFEFKKPVKWAIHSYFVFFPFVAVWLDKDNKLIEIRKIKPATSHVRPKKPFSKLIEIPINKRYSNLIRKLAN